MSTEISTLCFGTRGSALALWQTEHVMALLRSFQSELRLSCETIRTRGDEILDKPLPLVGGKGVFTAELEAALYVGHIDCAVHSLKDLPTEQPNGLVLGAIPARANPADILISRHGYTLASLPQGASVGTSSYRRAAQLLHVRPDLQILDIRGNVDTRIRKAHAEDGPYDAIVLAHAGVERLGRIDAMTEQLDFDVMLPAPGQGAIAVQCRNSAAVLDALRPIHHLDTALAVTAERAFLAGLSGGCSLPIAAYAVWDADQLMLRGRVCSRDGAERIDVQAIALVSDLQAALDLGSALAQAALEQGAQTLLERDE